jgi:hypothetical protein
VRAARRATTATRSRLLFRSVVPPGGTCTTRPCWTASSRGWQYGDRLRTTGVAKLKLGANDAGESSIRALAGGAALPLLALPYDPPLRAQLHAGDGVCWESNYAEADVVQTDRTVRARSVTPQRPGVYQIGEV